MVQEEFCWDRDSRRWKSTLPLLFRRFEVLVCELKRQRLVMGLHKQQLACAQAQTNFTGRHQASRKTSDVQRCSHRLEVVALHVHSKCLCPESRHEETHEESSRGRHG